MTLTMQKNRLRMSPLYAIALLAIAIACGGEKTPDATPAPPPPAPGGPITPCATCKVITVKMTTTESGNYYEPKEIEAHEGDVLRFTLVTGVHNVNFLPDSNPGKTNLPPLTDMLQLPGQTKDILLNFGTGHFYFQCDPHALLGMIGKLEVEKKES
jgi:plastocyanin